MITITTARAVLRLAMQMYGVESLASGLLLLLRERY